MLIRIVAVGQRPPAWAEEATSDYLRRMPPTLRTELVTVRTETRPKSGGNGRDPDGMPSRGTTTLMAREAERIRQHIPTQARVVVLDERGRDLTTRALATRLQAWQAGAQPVAILIGGPDGLDANLRGAADESIRLSSLTLPHALVRVLLAEQLWRAWSVLSNHPYHRE